MTVNFSSLIRNSQVKYRKMSAFMMAPIGFFQEIQVSHIPDKAWR